MPKWPLVSSAIEQTFAGSCTFSEYFPSSSTCDKNLVNFGPVTPEFRRRVCTGRAHAGLCHASSSILLSREARGYARSLEPWKLRLSRSVTVSYASLIIHK